MTDTLLPLLQRSLTSDRVHSAYLLSGAPVQTRSAALCFARGLVCTGEGEKPCEQCPNCARSRAREELPLDGSGSKGPLYRHVGDHPDLFWIERGLEDTRVRIGQIRALQHALGLRSSEGGRRAAVVADAEWLNSEAQNALLRLLEEPPANTSLILLTTSTAGLLATVRSRCLRVRFPAASAETEPAGPAAETARTWLTRFEQLHELSTPQLLDWAEEHRGARAAAAEQVEILLRTGARWLRSRVAEAAVPNRTARVLCEAFTVLTEARKMLVQRNANPQLIAERALFSLRDATQQF